MTAQTQALVNLFDALDRVPAERKEAAIAAAAECLNTARAMSAAGATREEIEAASDRIAAKYL